MVSLLWCLLQTPVLPRFKIFPLSEVNFRKSSSSLKSGIFFSRHQKQGLFLKADLVFLNFVLTIIKSFNTSGLEGDVVGIYLLFYFSFLFLSLLFFLAGFWLLDRGNRNNFLLRWFCLWRGLPLNDLGALTV